MKCESCGSTIPIWSTAYSAGERTLCKECFMSGAADEGRVAHKKGAEAKINPSSTGEGDDAADGREKKASTSRNAIYTIVSILAIILAVWMISDASDEPCISEVNLLAGEVYRVEGLKSCTEIVDDLSKLALESCNSALSPFSYINPEFSNVERCHAKLSTTQIDEVMDEWENANELKTLMHRSQQLHEVHWARYSEVKDKLNVIRAKIYVSYFIILVFSVVVVVMTYRKLKTA